MEAKPIFVITLTFPVQQSHQQDIREKLNGYHVIFLTGEEEKCQLFSIKETIELNDLKELQEYLNDNLFF